MPLFSRPFALLAATILIGTQAHAGIEPKALLTAADRARGGINQGLTWTVTVDSQDEGEKSSTQYQVRTKGDNAYVEVLEPARSKGEVFLFNDRTIWFFKPSLKKPVAISARQKLSGQAANGDIASTNYARDYEAKIVKEETVEGEACYVLELKSKGENTTYDGIRYWVSKQKNLGVKAEFLSLEGKAIKVATFAYKNKIKLEGKTVEFVSSTTISDAQNPGNRSVMTYAEPALVKAPDSLFNVNNLLR